MQEYFDLDIKPIQQRAKEVGLRHVRLRINDMDPLSLRLRLPEVIKSMHHEVVSTPPGIAYVHCTAGAIPSSTDPFHAAATSHSL
jgi:hypothetical protein